MNISCPVGLYNTGAPRCRLLGCSADGLRLSARIIPQSVLKICINISRFNTGTDLQVRCAGYLLALKIGMRDLSPHMAELSACMHLRGVRMVIWYNTVQKNRLLTSRPQDHYRLTSHISVYYRIV